MDDGLFLAQEAHEITIITNKTNFINYTPGK
jgi:hypothetical protein